jgi:hypothetical protein
MPSTVNMTRRQPRFTDWLRPRLRWITLPSWLASTGLHIGLLFLLIYLAQLRSCRQDIQGDGGDSWRQVGIVTREQTPASDSTTTQPSESDDTQTTEDSAESDLLTSANSIEQVPSAPPIELPALPETPEPVLGPGPTPGVSSEMLDNLVQSNTGGGPSAPASPGVPQGTSFLGASDVGSKFVYVIDKSYSMANDNALRAAKAELTASLQQLNDQQQFQVIFYNTDGVEVMQTRDRHFDLFWGTDAQRLLAANQYQTVQPHGGTDHYPALKRALDFNPDVIFFLTDGKEPPLSAADRASIVRMNRGARIHCIEFGKGPLPGDPALVVPHNWLQQLARENSGTYVYRDVNELFGRPR